jgi:hypothetical protein
MRNAAKTFFAVASLAVLGACSGNGDAQDNRANAIEANSSVVEVDTLPADESSVTPSDQLANGATEAPAEANLEVNSDH